MNKFLLKLCGVLLAFSLGATSAFAVSEPGSTAASDPTVEEVGSTNLGTGDTDEDGALTAADARALARAAAGLDAPAAPEDGDFNMDARVTSADARILLRAAAGIAPLATLDRNDAFAMHGLGLYDSILYANGRSFSAAEYLYYYESLYMSYVQQSYYYDQYSGEGYGAMLTGFDYTVPLSEQYLSAGDGSSIPYSEYFSDMTIAAMEQYSYYVTHAKEAQLELTDEDISALNETVESLTANAENYGMTPDEFLEEQYGSGVNLYVFERVAYDQLYAQKYQDHIIDDYKAQVTDDELEKAYAEDPSEYDNVTARVFRLPITTDSEAGTTDAEAQQAAAAAFAAKVKDEASFVAEAAKEDPVNFAEDENSLLSYVDYGTIADHIGDDAADWLFDSGRKTGDIKVFSATQYVYVLFVCTPAARNDELLPSVRHILFSYADEEELAAAGEEGVTDENGDRVPTKEEAREEAERCLAEYNKGKKTEDSFAELAEKYSDDTASLSAGGQGVTGGLYEEMQRGMFVPSFENWAFDAAREVGDTEIIESDWGYHVMYFCGRSEEPAWKSALREELASDRAQEHMETMSDEYAGSALYDGDEIQVALDDAVSIAAGFFS